MCLNILEENEERTMVEPKSYSDPKLQELMNILIDWVNDVLADHRIIVKNLEQDLYDGQVLQKLYGNIMIIIIFYFCIMCLNINNYF